MRFLFVAIWLVVVVGGFIGWVLNIIDILSIINDPITGLFVFRCVGVFFAPLGAVLGYF